MLAFYSDTLYLCIFFQDELQRDLMQERWDLVEAYPAQLRSYVPIFTAYTDTAFSGDEPAYKGLRIALRYEVGRFFAAVERLKAATNRKDLNASYVAYADMALHFDRYLNVGNLYTYRDDTVSLEKYFAGIDNSQLVYADPKKNPAEVRDLIVLISGPDKGRTGIMIGEGKRLASSLIGVSVLVFICLFLLVLLIRNLPGWFK
jgi:hypothetical protein